MLCPVGRPLGNLQGWRSSIAAGARKAGAGIRLTVFVVQAVGALIPPPSTYLQETSERGDGFRSASDRRVNQKKTPLPPPPLRLEKHFPPSPPRRLPSTQKCFIIHKACFALPFSVWPSQDPRDLSEALTHLDPRYRPLPIHPSRYRLTRLKSPRTTPPCFLVPLPSDTHTCLL